MHPTTTRVPDAVDKVLQLVTQEMPDLQVLDGPPAAQSLHDDVVCIGFYGPEGHSIDVRQERAQGWGARSVEVFELFCSFSSASGDLDMKPRRETCRLFLSELDQLLADHPTLDGVVDQVQVSGTLRWAQEQSQEGAACAVSFSIVGKTNL